jgi:hypothetical protein
MVNDVHDFLLYADPFQIIGFVIYLFGKPLTPQPGFRQISQTRYPPVLISVRRKTGDPG